MVYIALASFELQYYKLVLFRKKNICSCHFGVLKQWSGFLSSCRGYFADAYEVYLYYFELRFDVQLIAISWLISGSFEENFFCNGQTDGFCVGKRSFAALKEKAWPQPFEQL